MNIDIHLDGASGQEVLSVCLPHLSHSRKFRLFSRKTLRYGNAKDICYRGICCREAPALEHFELGSSGTFPITFQGLDGTSLFKGQAPRLRTFSLSHVVIRSHIPRGQLTQLKIVLSNEVPFYYVPDYGGLNQLIDLLVDCPGLETLVLGHCLPSQLTQISPGQTIHFPAFPLGPCWTKFPHYEYVEDVQTTFLDKALFALRLRKSEFLYRKRPSLTSCRRSAFPRSFPNRVQESRCYHQPQEPFITRSRIDSPSFTEIPPVQRL